MSPKDKLELDKLVEALNISESELKSIIFEPKLISEIIKPPHTQKLDAENYAGMSSKDVIERKEFLHAFLTDFENLKNSYAYHIDGNISVVLFIKDDGTSEIKLFYFEFLDTSSITPEEMEYSKKVRTNARVHEDFQVDRKEIIDLCLINECTLQLEDLVVCECNLTHTSEDKREFLNNTDYLSHILYYWSNYINKVHRQNGRYKIIREHE